MLAQMDAYMLPAGAGRNFTHSKSLLLLRDNLVAYSNITNIGDGYDGRPDALYNHTLVLSRESFASVRFDTRVLDKYFITEPPHGTLPRIDVEGSAPVPRLSRKLQHLAFPVLRALFLEQNVAISGVNDPSFLPDILVMLPPSMRMLPFCTYLPKPAQQPAYRLVAYDEHMRSLPPSFVHVGSSSVAYAGGDDLDDAVMFLIARVASGHKPANEVFSEFDQMTSNSPRDKLVLLSKLFGVSSSPRLQARQADAVMRMLRKFDAETQSRLMRRIAPFLDRKSRDTVLHTELDKKITAKSVESLLDGVAGHKKRRVLNAVYGARGRDFEKSADRLLGGILDSPHAPDVCSFFVSTEGLHPSLLKFLSGKTRASPKRRRRLLDLVLPAAIKDNPKLVPEILACNIHDRQSKSDARDLLETLGAMTESEQVGSDLVADALASALGKSGGGSAPPRRLTEPSAPPARMGGGGVARRRPARRLRDPIHGFIDVYENEMAVIQDPVFQRLRRIKQLSFAHLVYHGAEHSRFGHVLGTMHLAGRALRSIKANSEKSGVGIDVDDEDVRTARMAALLHDVGHRPFSHALDRLFEESHEDLSEALVLGRFAPMIEGTGPDGVDPKRVADLIQYRVDGQKPFLAELIAGQLDVDKMDYLLRDSYYAGVKYGTFDLDMLMDSLVLTENKLAVSSKGIMAAEQMIIARYHMFGQVYHHKTKRAFENMVKAVACRLFDGEDLQYPSAKSLYDDADDLVGLDDAWMMKEIASYKGRDLSGVVKDALARKPFEEVLNSDTLPTESGSSEEGIGYFIAMQKYVRANLESIGLEPNDVMVDRSSVLPYRLLPYHRELHGDPNTDRVLIRYSESESVPIEQRSKIVKSITQEFPVHRMFVRKTKASRLRTHLDETHSDTRRSR